MRVASGGAPGREAHPAHFPSDLIRHIALPHSVFVSGGGSAAQFQCFGDLTKALAFSSQRSARRRGMPRL